MSGFGGGGSSKKGGISTSSVLFNEDGYAIGALQDGKFIPIENAGLLVGGKDNEGKFQSVPISDSGSVEVSQTSKRKDPVKYFAGSSNIAGQTSEQNLLSIENPSGSNIDVFINRVFVNGVTSSISTNIFLYRIGRTTDFPSSGSIISAEKRRTSEPNATTVIREEPTATPSSGFFWVNSPGMNSSDGTMNTNNVEVFNPKNEDAEIVIEPGEAVLVSAEANTINWNHWVNIYWTEVPID